MCPRPSGDGAAARPGAGRRRVRPTTTLTMPKPVSLLRESSSGALASAPLEDSRSGETVFRGARSYPAGPRQVGQVPAGVGERPVGQRFGLRRVAGALVDLRQPLGRRAPLDLRSAEAGGDCAVVPSPRL